jgi:archaemetzincin
MSIAQRRSRGRQNTPVSRRRLAVMGALLAGVGLALWLAMALTGRKPEQASPALPPPQDVIPSGPSPERVASEEDSRRAERLTADIEKLRPLAVALGQPQPGDWLERFKEPGQTFDQYLGCRPVRPTNRRGVIHIQPLGDFSKDQRRIVTLTADFMAIYFGLPVRIDEDLPDDLVPAQARRRHPAWGMEQMLTSYILDRVLRPRLPDDAAAFICFTTTDLWPGKDWNFVFGQASLAGRVGVWSISRFGDPAESEEAFRLALLRTMKLGTHETGHMFSLLHCTAYQCNMCGCNSPQESDRHPLALCPVCLAKICWATRTEPAERYRQLVEFCRAQGLKAEEERYRQLLDALEGRGTPPQPASAVFQENDPLWMSRRTARATTRKSVLPSRKLGRRDWF